MSLPRYESYKDSGVKWLGEVPEHWEMQKVSRNFIARKGANASNLTKEYCSTIEGEYPVYSGQTENNGVMSSINQFEFDAGNEGYLFSTTVGAKAMTLLNVVGKFSLSQNCMVIIPISKEINIRFVYYHLQPAFSYERNLIPEHMQASFRMEDLYQYLFALPTSHEQSTIANFLDQETAKIDNLIAEQQQLIKLLKEKRQAVISHAVTKGLNPDVPMKDSGIEWLGEVPEHWEMKRLKNISPFIAVGIVVNPSEYVSEEGLPYIYGGDISEGKINTQNCRRISDFDSKKNAKTRLSVGDLLTVRVGAPGITAVVTEDCEDGNCASVMLIKRGSFASNWLCYAMNSRIVRFQVQVVQYGAAQEQFNISHAVNFWIVTPPIDEQRTILIFLDNETTKLDILTKEAKIAINLLQERRSALISSAVTGKIDVRNFVPSQPNVEAMA